MTNKANKHLIAVLRLLDEMWSEDKSCAISGYSLLGDDEVCIADTVRAALARYDVKAVQS